MKTFVIGWVYIGVCITMKQTEAACPLSAATNVLPEYYSLYLEHNANEDKIFFEDFREWMYDNCEIDVEVLEIQ